MSNKLYGEIEDVPVGSVFKDRKELSQRLVHLAPVAGIDGDKNGARSIVLNGGYSDDYDEGDEILYTGHGGNLNGKQIANQSWDTTGNKALLISELNEIPIRVTRGFKHRSPFSPQSGYRYDGLYLITEHFEDVGPHGFKICRFRLNQISGPRIPGQSAPSGIQTLPQRTQTSFLRILRDSQLSRNVKSLYDYRCQVCQTRIELKGIFYAEGAHIRPLGKPHNGHDTMNNILCLCPNHHVMLDKGVFTISSNFELVGINGNLYVHPQHLIDASCLEYHAVHVYGRNQI